MSNYSIALNSYEPVSLHARMSLIGIVSSSQDAWIYGVLRGYNTAPMLVVVRRSPLAAQHNIGFRSGIVAFESTDAVRLRLVYPHESEQRRKTYCSFG